MFVRPDGTYECALSGGCLEPTVAETAARVIATGEPVIVTYNLTDDSVWGLGIGCSGTVDIRIKRIANDALMNEWLAVLEEEEAAILDHAAFGRVRPDDRSRLGRRCGRVDRSGPRANQCRTRPRACGVAVSGLRSRAHRRRRSVLEVTLPSPRLVVFGAGHDVVPVVQLGWTLGFAVTVSTRSVPDVGAIRQRDSGVCAFPAVCRACDARTRQLRAHHEPSHRARPGEPSVQPRVGRCLHRRAQAAVALR